MSRFANFGGNWNNGANSGSRYVNTNASSNSNTNNGGRGVCDDSLFTLCTFREAVQADHKEWSAWLSCLGKHTLGSGRTRSSALRNAEAAFHGEKIQTAFRSSYCTGEFSGRISKNQKGQKTINQLFGIQGIRPIKHRATEARGGRWRVCSSAISDVFYLRSKIALDFWIAVSGSRSTACAEQCYRADIRQNIPAVHVCLSPRQGHARGSFAYPICFKARQSDALSQNRFQQILPVNTGGCFISAARCQDKMPSNNAVNGDYNAKGLPRYRYWQPSKPTERKPIRHVGGQFCASQIETNGMGALYG